MTKKKSRRSSAGVAIGGIVAGIEQQIFRTTPPVNELVAKGAPLRATAASGGGTLDVAFPEDEPRESADQAEPAVPTEPTEPSAARP